MTECLPFEQSVEWWKSECALCPGKTHAELAVYELGDHGEVGRRGWHDRRARARQLFAGEVNFVELKSGHKRADCKLPPPDPALVGSLPEPAIELTTDEKVAIDREVMQLRAKLSDLQSRYDAANREHTVEAKLLDAFEGKVGRLPAVPAPGRKAVAAGGGLPETVVALFSDAHIGEVVSGEEMNGLAWYDFTTFAARYQHFVDSITSICFGKLTGYTLNDLEVFMLGDMVSGIIHEELVETAEGTVMEWLLDGAHVVAQGLRDLATRFSSVKVRCVVGNHGRLTKQVRFKKRYVNYDYLFYHLLRLELADQENITFDIPKSFWHLVEVEGHTFLLLHGDNIKSWNGIPWYGIERAMLRLTTLLASQRRFFDYACVAHFHNAGALDRVNGELILNGSLPGGNEFSIGALFASTMPRQVIFGVHPEHGKTWSYGIDLSAPSEEVRYRWDGDRR